METAALPTVSAATPTKLGKPREVAGLPASSKASLAMGNQTVAKVPPRQTQLGLPSEKKKQVELEDIRRKAREKNMERLRSQQELDAKRALDRATGSQGALSAASSQPSKALPSTSTPGKLTSPSTLKKVRAAAKPKLIQKDPDAKALPAASAAAPPQAIEVRTPAPHMGLERSGEKKKARLKDEQRVKEQQEKERLKALERVAGQAAFPASMTQRKSRSLRLLRQRRHYLHQAPRRVYRLPQNRSRCQFQPWQRKNCLEPVPTRISRAPQSKSHCLRLDRRRNYCLDQLPKRS
jgi:hypothetical protein